ncbi:MAG: FmdB family zinc ribbon protein [Thiohalomonadales bacterium]
MPIYEYKCEECGHRMEAMQKMSEDALKDCPECAAPKLKKLMSAVAFRLKGSGWYETDFKAGDKKNLANSDDAAPSKKEDKSETKKEAKKDGKSSDKSASKPSDTSKSSKEAPKTSAKKPKSDN